MTIKLQKTLPIMIVIALICLAVGGYFYYQYQKTQKELQSLKNNPTQISQEETQKLIAEVGKLVALPNDETPTIATVSDIDKLKDQVFFQKAKNGDKVLIYYQAKKAYLYDPIAKKLIDVAPINVADNTASGSADLSQVSGVASASAQARILLRNGTKTVGLTNKYEPTVKKALPDAVITDKENAAKTDYDRSIVITLTPSFDTQAQSLAKALKATVESMPAGESTPKDTDLVVILGKDQK